MRHKFTKGWIEGLTVTTRTRFTDTTNPTLTLRVTPTGTKTFYYRARHKHRGVVERKIGPFPQWTIEQARTKATEMAASFNAGVDPEAAAKEAAKKQQQDNLTLDQAFTEWMDEFDQLVKDGERRARTAEVYRATYNNHLKVQMGSKPLKAITGELLADYLKDRALGVTNHNLVRVVFNSIHKHAQQKHKLDAPNPVAQVKTRKGKARDRFLQPDEVARLFESIEQEEQVYQDLVRILLFTGQRKGAVYSMEWAEINLERGTWTIPARKMKGKKAHTIPLIPEVLQILQRRQQEIGGRYAFPWKGGHLPRSHYFFWTRIVKRAGLWSENRDESLTIHDLRRTLASWQAAEGVGIHQISKTLAHQDVNLTASVYAHIQAESTRAGIQAAVAAISRAGGQVEQTGPVVQDAMEALLAAMTPDEKAALMARLKGE